MSEKETTLMSISEKEASQAVQDFVDTIFESGQCHIVDPTTEEVTAAKKILGIDFPNDNFHIVEGVFLKADKKNKNGHFLSSETVKEALQSIAFTPVNLNHQINRPIGFYASASFNETSNKVTTRALIWRHRFPEEVALIKQWIEEGDAGQSFELTFGRRALRQDTGAIELENVTFRGGAILRRSRAAEPRSSATITAALTDCSSVYGGINEMSTIGDYITVDEKAKLAKLEENVDDDVKTARHSLDTVETLLMEAQCPTCGGKYNDVVSIDVENEAAVMRCSNSGCGSFHRPEDHPDRDKTEDTNGIFTVQYSLQTATVNPQEENSMAEKTRDKVFTQAELDEKVAEAITQHDLIKERRAELGDIAKGTEDVDLLKDDVYSSLQKDKKIVDLTAENESLKEKAKASEKESEKAKADESKKSEEGSEEEKEEKKAEESNTADAAANLNTGGETPLKGATAVADRMGEIIASAKR